MTHHNNAQLSIGNITSTKLQSPDNFEASFVKPHNMMDMDCGMLMMPMLFEMGHKVIYLFEG